MVKTEVIENVAEDVIHYPLIAERNGDFVLFTESCIGTVLQSLTYPVGYYSDEWREINFWDILPKGVKIVLENG